MRTADWVEAMAVVAVMAVGAVQAAALAGKKAGADRGSNLDNRNQQ